jgi:heptosyltransferase I
MPSARLPPPTAPARLCVLRLSAIGDVSHVVPVVCSLRAAWPTTEITWCIGRVEHRLLEGLPGVRFAVLDKSAGWRGYRALWRAAGREPFDVLLHAQVSLRANLASVGLRAPVRLGYDIDRAKDLHSLFVNEHIPAAHGQHVLDGFFSFAAALGVHQRRLEWPIPVSGEDEAYVAALVPDDGPVLVISPCGSHPLRNWLAERYAAVADLAIARHGMRVVLSGGPGETDLGMAAAIQAAMRHQALNLTGRTTLKQLLALLKRASLLLSPDSGPAHLGTAAGTPVIALHATSNPERTGPYLSRQWCVNRYDEAARRFLGRPAAELRWGERILKPGVMALIGVDEVVERLDAFMAAGMPRPSG